MQNEERYEAPSGTQDGAVNRFKLVLFVTACLLLCMLWGQK